MKRGGDRSISSLIAGLAGGPVTPQQVLAARALLGWTQIQLGAAADLNAATVKNIETGRTVLKRSYDRVIRVLQDAGVLFLDGCGVILSERPDAVVPVADWKGKPKSRPTQTGAWTDDEYRILSEKYPSADWTVIGRALPGRTRAAIMIVAHRLGLRRLREDLWSSEEEDRLRQAWVPPHPDVPAIASSLNRTARAVVAKAHELGLAQRPKGRRSPPPAGRRRRAADLSA